MATHDKQALDKSISRESLFRSIANKRYGKTAIKDLSSKILDASDLEERAIELNLLRSEVARLALSAPKDIKLQVESILKSNSKYLNLKNLRNYLQKSKSEKEIPSNIFFDSERLMRDIQGGSYLSEFMAKYRDMPLDVVSVNELKTVQSKLGGELKVVIDQIDEQLKYVSNERRQSLTLGDFMTKHHYLNTGSFRHYSSDLLKNQIENALGRAEPE